MQLGEDFVALFGILCPLVIARELIDLLGKLCGQRRRLHACRHHRSDIRDASGMAYRRKRALFAMPCGCDRRLQSATRRDLVIEACVRIISSCGDQSLGETPGPIPNPEAKA